MKRLLALFTGVLLTITGLVTTGPTNSALAATRPVLSPQPQQVRWVGEPLRLTATARIVVGNDSDEDSLRVVRDLLENSGVDKVEVVQAPAEPGKSFTVWLGDAPAAVVASLGATPAAGLADEGYALTVGTDAQDRRMIILDGVDTDGTYYAAQTLRQLVSDVPGTPDAVAGAVIRDWPATEFRGSIEGFYGTPWSHEQRLDHVRYLGEHKMNTYIYTPKDDPYLRARWREPYPQADRQRIAELVNASKADKVDFTYAVSPGLSVCYSSAADRQALVDKFESVHALGVRSFVVPLDDIEYTHWNCAQDEQVYGTGQAAAGRAQADLLNYVQEKFVDLHADLLPLQTVPTQYYDVNDSPYKAALRQHLDQDVIVQWTGVGVVAPVITTAHAQAAADVWQRDIVIWDNFPVNDYAPGRLLLGDYRGREPDVTGVVDGILSNPMNQAAVSKVALYSFAEYSWNPTDYVPAESHLRALTEVGAGDPATVAALRLFADLNNYDGQIHRESAPALAAQVEKFWQTWDSGRRGTAVEGLRPVANGIVAAPATIRAGVPDKLFVAEAKAWLDATELWGQAMQQSLVLLQALDGDDGAAAWAARQQVTSLVARARAIRDTTVVHNSTHPRIAEGVLDTFIAQVSALHDRWFGVQGGNTVASTNLPTYQSYSPALMTDGNPDTWFWSSRAVRTGDWVGLDLGSIVEIGDLSLLMARSASPGDYIQQGVLEYSLDGTTWTALTQAQSATVEFSAAAGTQARFVRYRATADNPGGQWLIVREFSAEVLSGLPRLAGVTATPPAASGSSASFASDANVASAYVASRAPAAGEALQLNYSRSEALAAVTVLQRTGKSGTGTLQVRAGGNWRDVGAVSGPWTRIQAKVDGVDAVRIVWAAGSAAPEVAEVIPTWAAQAAPTLTTGTLDLVRGRPNRVDVVVNAGLGGATTGTVALVVPDGWTVSPTSAPVDVPSGLGQVASFEVTPPASAALADVDLRAVLSDGSGATLASLGVTAHVRPVVGDQNVALGRPASASGVEPSTNHQPGFAVDGDATTRWASGYDDASWWQVDLGTSTAIGKVTISWEAAHASEYQVQVSEDGTTWTTAATVTDSAGGLETVWVVATGRYVRMQGVKRATTWGYSMFEFQVFAQQ